MNEPRAPAVWQVSGGPADRPYTDLFLEYGLALIGPGESGSWCPGQSDEDAHVRRFAQEPQSGDLLLLRTGLSTVFAVGLVAGDYGYLEPFGQGACFDLTPNERRIAEDRRDCYWLYIVTNCAEEPVLQEPIPDPACFEWNEVKKVQHYYLQVDAMTQPMQVRETLDTHHREERE